MKKAEIKKRVQNVVDIFLHLLNIFGFKIMHFQIKTNQKFHTTFSAYANSRSNFNPF